MKIILGSQSSGRREVLTKMGYTFEIMPADIDEKQIRLDDPVELTIKLANAKADALLTKISGTAILITSDQVVVCHKRILEKPENTFEAHDFLQLIQDYPAKTVTSVTVVNTATGKRVSGTDIAKIWFKNIPKNIINQYIAGQDPFLRAGGFDHNHPLLHPYVSKIEGEEDSITGLPRALTDKLIKSVQ